MYSEACESSYLNSFTAQSTCYIIRAVSQLAWYLCHSVCETEICRYRENKRDGRMRPDSARTEDGGASLYVLLCYLFANIVAQRTTGKISSYFARTNYVHKTLQSIKWPSICIVFSFGPEAHHWLFVVEVQIALKTGLIDATQIIKLHVWLTVSGGGHFGNFVDFMSFGEKKQLVLSQEQSRQTFKMKIVV